MENLNRFYDWMLAMNNIHLADNEKMAKAYEIVAESDRKSVLPTKIQMFSPKPTHKSNELVIDKSAFQMLDFIPA
jgi:hypothetical protein